MPGGSHIGQRRRRFRIFSGPVWYHFAVTFILRLDIDDSGRVRGVVERVSTGAKEAFIDLDALGPLVGRMIAAPVNPIPKERP